MIFDGLEPEVMAKFVKLIGMYKESYSQDDSYSVFPSNWFLIKNVNLQVYLLEKAIQENKRVEELDEYFEIIDAINMERIENNLEDFIIK